MNFTPSTLHWFTLMGHQMENTPLSSSSPHLHPLSVHPYDPLCLTQYIYIYIAKASLADCKSDVHNANICRSLPRCHSCRDFSRYFHLAAELFLYIPLLSRDRDCPTIYIHTSTTSSPIRDKNDKPSLLCNFSKIKKRGREENSATTFYFIFFSYIFFKFVKVRKALDLIVGIVRENFSYIYFYFVFEWGELCGMRGFIVVLKIKRGTYTRIFLVFTQ